MVFLFFSEKKLTDFTIVQTGVSRCIYRPIYIKYILSAHLLFKWDHDICNIL